MFYQYGYFLFMKVKRNLHSVDLNELHILFMTILDVCEVNIEYQVIVN